MSATHTPEGGKLKVSLGWTSNHIDSIMRWQVKVGFDWMFKVLWLLSGGVPLTGIYLI